ncbi:MAG: AbrB/MazE/SpoVT family DNA-binding domain-containing protein [Patescibacteria group bacterium]
MTQKVLKVGSSAAVTIPKESLKKLRLKIGDQLDVETRQDMMIVRPAKKGSVRDEEVIAWTKKFIEEYRPALEVLAKK